MSTVPALIDALQTLFGRFAEEAARDTGFIQRQRKVSGSAFLQTLTFGWLDDPHASLGDLGDVAETLDLSLSRQGLHQRFTPQAFAFLWAVLQEALQRGLTAAPPVLPLLRRFNGTYLLDSSTISLPATLAALLPGCGGQVPDEGTAACKIQLCVEIAGGGLEEIVLLGGRTNDLECPLAHRPLPAGALRLADLGFYDLRLLQRYSEEGVFWVSRLHPGTLVFAAEGRPTQLLEFLRAQPPGGFACGSRMPEGSHGCVLLRFGNNERPRSRLARRGGWRGCPGLVPGCLTFASTRSRPGPGPRMPRARPGEAHVPGYPEVSVNLPGLVPIAVKLSGS